MAVLLAPRFSRRCFIPFVFLMEFRFFESIRYQVKAPNISQLLYHHLPRLIHRADDLFPEFLFTNADAVDDVWDIIIKTLILINNVYPLNWLYLSN